MKIFKMRWLVGGLLTVVAISAVSCAFFSKKVIDPPVVKLESVGIQSMNTDSVTVLFAVSVDNPNSFALKLDSVRYEAEFGNHPFVSGEIKDIPEAPGKKKTVISLPIPVKYTDLFSSVLDYLSNRSTKYHVKGEAKFAGLFSIPFDESGDLQVKKDGTN